MWNIESGFGDKTQSLRFPTVAGKDTQSDRFDLSNGRDKIVSKIFSLLFRLIVSYRWNIYVIKVLLLD